MAISMFRRKINRLKSACENAINENINLNDADTSKLYDFAAKRAVHYRDLIKNSINDINSYLPNLRFLQKTNKFELARIIELLEQLNHINPKLLIDVCDELLEVTNDLGSLGTISGPVVINAPANIPTEIREEIRADIEEMQKCFNAGCYRSATILCGRVLETVLHRKYYEVTGMDILEKNPGIGLGKLIAKLVERNITFDPGLTQQIHLINQSRIFSVHKQQTPFYPTQEQSHAVILYTLDVVGKMF